MLLSFSHCIFSPWLPLVTSVVHHEMGQLEAITYNSWRVKVILSKGHRVFKVSYCVPKVCILLFAAVPGLAFLFRVSG